MRAHGRLGRASRAQPAQHDARRRLEEARLPDLEDPCASSLSSRRRASFEKVPALTCPRSRSQQNTGGNKHACGFCGFGCVYGEKQGGTVTWLKDASEHGAKFLVKTTVERLLFASSPTAALPTPDTLDKYTPTATRRHCIGALIRDSEDRLALVRARQSVVVSAGTIHSPAVLMRSGLKNSRIGRNLRLHPVVVRRRPLLVRPWRESVH